MNNSFFGGIRQQIVGLFVIMFSVLTAASYTLFEVHLFGDFKQVEIQRGQQNVMRIEKLISYIAERFRRTVAVDWAQYDKAFEYVTGVNKDFIERDLSWESAQLTGFLHFVVTDRDGVVLGSGEYVDTDQSVQTLKASALQDIIGNATIREFMKRPIAGSLAGLIRVERRPHFVAISQILPTSGEGTPGGFLLFTKPADDKTLGDLSELSQLNVSFSEPTDTQPVTSTGKYDSLHFDGGNLTGSIDILDLNQEPILRAQFDYPHDILSKGYKTKSALLWAIASFLVIGSILLWLALDHVLLRPLNTMARQLSTLTYAELCSHRLDESRSGELGVLARVFNRLMSSLSTSYEELVRAKNLAEAASTAKSSFIARISHELRTPIHGITGMLRILLREEQTSSKRNYIMMARNAAYVLLETINEILDFSKAEAGKLALERIEFSLHSTVREALQIVGPRIEEKGSLEAIAEIPQGLPDKVYGDPLRLRQILVNLLGNAAKFTKQGHIGLRISICEQSKERVSLTFTVFDTGIGIPADRLDNIFEPFSQVDESVSRMFTGTGLGLTIVKQIVQSMNGRIRVESQLGVGSRFILDIPFDCAADAKPIVCKPQLSSSRIALVDGDSITIRQFAQELKANGYTPQITNCAQASEVVALTQSLNEYGLIIVTSEALKRSRVFDMIVGATGSQNIPIVAVLSPFEISVRERLLALRVPFVVTRPTSVLDILGAMSGTLSISGETWDEAQECSLQSARPLEILVADDAPTNRIILTELLRDAGHNVVCVENGVELVSRVKDSLNGVPGTPSFDIILTDVQMPLLDGLNATSQIRALEKDLGLQSGLPIVAVTAHAMTEETSRMRNFGVNDVVTKPLDPLKLGEVIQRLTGQQADVVDKGAASVAIARNLSDSQFVEIGLAVWNKLAHRDQSFYQLFELSKDRSDPENFQMVLDLADVLERSGDSVRRSLLILRGFLDCFHEQLQALNQAKQSNNAEDLRFAAHAIKGLMLDIGAHSSSKLASNIEQMSKNQECAQAFSLVGQLTKQVLVVSRLVDQIEQLSTGSKISQHEEPVDSDFV